MDELLEMIFEQFGTSGTDQSRVGQDARIGRQCVRECTDRSRDGRDDAWVGRGCKGARIGRGLVAMHGSVA